MATDAPAHLQRADLVDLHHCFHFTVANGAVHAGGDVAFVVEMHVPRQQMNLRPDDRLLFLPVLGENFAWRKDPLRKRAYIRAGWIWVALFVSRLLVQYPLYKSNHINWLGTARLVMGTPLFLLVGWATWLVLRKVPTTKPEVEA